MSYLDVPRIHFSGTFQADPSTVNNAPQNFGPTVSNPVLFWNPNGTGAFKLEKCTVRTAVDKKGNLFNSSDQDPIVGAKVQSTDSPVVAKIVDLDPQQQLVSELYGLEVKISVSNTDYVVGKFKVVCFDDLWQSRMLGQGNGEIPFSATYQSVLENVTWGNQSMSPTLKALRRASPNMLSIKFVVDRYTMGQGSNFTKGRIVGTIGPAKNKEPHNFLAGRCLRPSGNPQESSMFYGYARVDKLRSRVLLDLGNSIQAPAPGNPDLPFGKLHAAICPVNSQITLLGKINSKQSNYQKTAAIHEFKVSKHNLALLDKNPLGVVEVESNGGTKVLLRENSNGSFVNATQFVHRLNPGEKSTVRLLALKYGKPQSGEKINLKLDISRLTVRPNDPEMMAPPEALKFPATVTTGSDGWAKFTISAKDPGNPRRIIDGQIYPLTYYWPAEGDSEFRIDLTNFLSILIFSAYEKKPIWKNVKPIMEQYAKLYPWMNNLFPLDDPTQLRQWASRLKVVFSFPTTDPRYMPVTRDLSKDKKKLILNWLKQNP